MVCDMVLFWFMLWNWMPCLGKLQVMLCGIGRHGIGCHVLVSCKLCYAVLEVMKIGCDALVSCNVMLWLWLNEASANTSLCDAAIVCDVFKISFWTMIWNWALRWCHVDLEAPKRCFVWWFCGRYRMGWTARGVALHCTHWCCQVVDP